MMKLGLLSAACLVLSSAAFAGSPKLYNVLPVAGQRGQTVEVSFHGERLHDATSVLFHTQGIQAGELVFGEKNKDKQVKTTFTIPADAPVGEHQLRLVTATGVTEMFTFKVVDRPIVKEQRDEPSKNGKSFKQTTSFEEPQMLDLGVSVLGRTEAEDVDFFAVQLKKGQSFVAEVHGIRLGRGFTDSTLTVYDNNRRVMAESDDTLLHLQDPSVAFIAPHDGRYILELRDSGYEGTNNNWYLMHVGEAVRPTLAYPLGGQPGQKIELKMLGDMGGTFTQSVQLPGEPNDAFEVIAERDGLKALTGLPFRVTAATNVMEDPAAKNDSMNDLKEVAGQSLPVAFNGVIQNEGDTDYYRVTLKKGQQVTFRCFARSMGSPLDSVINIFNAADNKHIVGNDDQGGSDSIVELTAPADGDYFVRVRDHRNRGGEHYVYRVEVTQKKPSLSTAITRYDRNRPQERQAIAVPKGNRYAALVSVARVNAGGDLDPQIANLPNGVSFKGLGAAQQGSLMPVVFEATPDAQLGSQLINIEALAKPKSDSSEQIRGGFRQVTPLVTGNPNRTEYYSTTLDTHAIAVTEAIPFKIDVVQPKAPLVHGGKQKLQVKLTRNEGYEEVVRLYMLYRPPGMGAPGSITLNKTDTEGVYEIDANGGMPVRDWPMAIVGWGNQKGGAVWASSQLFNIKVEEPFVKGTIDSAKCDQGQSTDIVVNLEHARDWQGEGELKLLGLPAETTADPIKIKPGQEQAKFRVNVSEKTPARTHKTLMLELTIMVNGEPVIHRFGQGGRLRVDRPGKDNAQAKGK